MNILHWARMGKKTICTEIEQAERQLCMKKEQKPVSLTIIRGQVNCSVSETLQVFFTNEHRHTEHFSLSSKK